MIPFFLGASVLLAVAHARPQGQAPNVSASVDDPGASSTLTVPDGSTSTAPPPTPSDSSSIPSISTEASSTPGVPSPTPTPSDTASPSASAPQDSSTTLADPSTPSAPPSDTPTPFPSSTLAPSESPSSSSPSSTASIPAAAGGSKSNVGAIAGGVVGGLALVAIIVFGILFFLRKRNQHQRVGRRNSYPPSPRLKSPWTGGSGVLPTAAGHNGGNSIRARAQRLGSQGSIQGVAEIAPSTSLDSDRYGPTSEQDHYTAAAAAGQRPMSDDAHEVDSHIFDDYPVALGGPSARRSHRSRDSRTSFPVTASNSRASYDLSVFRNSNPPTPVQSTPSPLSPTSPTSATQARFSARYSAGAEPTDLTRQVSTSNRLARKPAPKYLAESFDSGTTTLDGASGASGESIATQAPSASRTSVGSKPPTTGPYTRGRTISAGSRGSKTGKPPGGAHELAHKESTGTFKFAGEKEGPVHYLIPDMPLEQS